MLLTEMENSAIIPKVAAEHSKEQTKCSQKTLKKLLTNRNTYDKISKLLDVRQRQRTLITEQ